MSIERQAQHIAADTLRWGDVAPFQWLGGVDVATLQPSKQLIAATWRWPLTWKLLCAAAPAIPASETATFTVVPQVTIGSGGASLTLDLPPLIVAPPYGTVVAFYDVPALDIQARVRLTGLADAAASVGESISVGLFTAPVTEPHAMTLLLEGFARDERFGQGERQGQWMPPGFHPEALGYHR